MRPRSSPKRPKHSRVLPRQRPRTTGTSWTRSPPRRRRSPSPARSSRSRRSRSRSRSRSRERIEDDRDRRIRQLENQLRESEKKIENLKASALVLEQRLQVAIETRSVLEAETENATEKAAVLSNEVVKSKSISYDRLNMQVQTQAILLRNFHSDNQQLNEELARGRNRFDTMKYYLQDCAVQAEEIKDDWASLRNDFCGMVSDFMNEFNETRGVIYSICNGGLLMQKVDKYGTMAEPETNLGAAGKISVKERHLKGLLETVIFHLESVAQDCCDALQKSSRFTSGYDSHSTEGQQ